MHYQDEGNLYIPLNISCPKCHAKGPKIQVNFFEETDIDANGWEGSITCQNCGYERVYSAEDICEDTCITELKKLFKSAENSF